MELNKIKEYLCIYDIRNPDFDESYTRLNSNNPCSCDNCFYRRHELANELLKYIEL